MLRSDPFQQKARTILLKWKFDSTPDKSTRTVSVGGVYDAAPGTTAVVPTEKTTVDMEVKDRDCFELLAMATFHIPNTDVNAL